MKRKGNAIWSRNAQDRLPSLRKLCETISGHEVGASIATSQIEPVGITETLAHLVERNRAHSVCATGK